MSEDTTRKAIESILNGSAKYLILSTAYEDTWKIEAYLKKKIAIEAGVKPEVIKIIPGITSTRDEIGKIKDMMETINGRSLILVAERYHLPRALLIFRKMLPDLTVYSIPVSCQKYEMLKEPSLIKSIRAGFAPLWILWNVIFYLRALISLKKIGK